jgi:hypothetical protein
MTARSVAAGRKNNIDQSSAERARRPKGERNQENIDPKNPA